MINCIYIYLKSKENSHGQLNKKVLYLVMTEITLNSIRERLNLRKISIIDIPTKNKTIKKLAIGFMLIQGELKFKVSILSDVPFENSSEEEISHYVLEKISDFKIKFKKEIDKAFHVLNVLSHDKKDRFISAFKNSFAGALADYTSDQVKLDLINRAFKTADKKMRLLEKVHEEELKIKKIIDKLQITEYHTYFSFARGYKRKLKLYLGPTNSGKTYHALNDLTSHDRGVYLSPLRLLAWEGKEEIEKRGKLASLITGEEKQIVEGAEFKSQTIETLNFSEETDAVLIDEVQMLYDESRGWAWTQALIGAPCKELIMAGSPEAEPLVKKISELLGEELEIIRLNRFNPLEVKDQPYDFEKDIGNLPEGTAVIAFSRKNVLWFKKQFESKNKPVSVIYGNLSPEVRKEEARKFRDGVTKYLISTDAISMGLNLPISNIIFTTVEKFNGTEMSSLTSMEVKQISGRAGRFGKVEKGFVSAFDKGTLKYIRNFIKADSHVNNFMYIKPSIEHIKKIGEELNTSQLFPIMTFFTNKVMSKDNTLYICANLDEQKEIAMLLDKIQGLSLEDKFLFTNAPVPGEDHYQIYLRWIKRYQSGKDVPLPVINDLNPRDFNFDNQLILENYVKLLHLYSWLTYKKLDLFPDQDKCLRVREESNKKIEKMLSSKVILKSR